MNAVELKGVSKTFVQGENQIAVLQDLDLAVAPGKTLAIVGQSGSGKTTLLTLIAGLDTPDEGSIKVLNQELLRLSEDELATIRRRDMAIVFQQFHLFKHLSALENVLLPLEISGRKTDGAVEAAKHMLARVGLSHRMDHFPSQLSGGECQRLAIARALVIKPKLLLADEPSGNLDHATGDQIIKLMFQLVREEHLTLILVTHNLELADLCDQKLQLT